MAFASGDIITATALNSVNDSNGYFSGTLADSEDYIQSSIGNNGKFYSYRASGTTLFWCSLYCGLFGGGHIYVYRTVNGSETCIASGSWGWNTNTTWTVNSQGEGWYRIYSDDLQFAAIPWKCYFGQNNCTTGDFLIEHYDKFTGGIDRSSHNTLTADLLNTGRVGTVASLS